MTGVDLVNLTALMERTTGAPEITIGLIDGPVAVAHPHLVVENIREVPAEISATCAQATDAACVHGTFVAGVLCGKRHSPAPAICPGCTLLVRPVFPETTPSNPETPTSRPDQLAAAIID